jgi:hypothetical protein
MVLDHSRGEGTHRHADLLGTAALHILTTLSLD